MTGFLSYWWFCICFTIVNEYTNYTSIYAFQYKYHTATIVITRYEWVFRALRVKCIYECATRYLDLKIYPEMDRFGRNVEHLCPGNTSSGHNGTMRKVLSLLRKNI